jgi:ferredoxin
MRDKKHLLLFTVEVDTELCSLCEACAHHCPTGALSIEQIDGTMSLFFRRTLCHGCSGMRSCQDLCPEHAVRLFERKASASKTVPDDTVLLARSEMLQCQYCGEYFSPVQKITVISRRSGKKKEPIREFCPLCRRTNMVVQFIDEKRMPTGKAEYRSCKDILRRAKKRVESEKEKQ